MRRSIIVLIVVGIIVTAAVLVDIFAKGMAERAVATSVQEGLELEEEPGVAIGSFPFIVNLLNGVVPEVSLDAENVGRGRVRFDLVTLNLSNVRLDTSTLISGEAESITIGGGQGRAVMSATTLSRCFDERVSMPRSSSSTARSSSRRRARSSRRRANSPSRAGTLS